MKNNTYITSLVIILVSSLGLFKPFEKINIEPNTQIVEEQPAVPNSWLVPESWYYDTNATVESQSPVELPGIIESISEETEDPEEVEENEVLDDISDDELAESEKEIVENEISTELPGIIESVVEEVEIPEEESLDNYGSLSLDYIQAQGNVSQEAINMAYDIILSQDAKVLNHFLEDGGIFVVTDQTTINNIYASRGGLIKKSEFITGLNTSSVEDGIFTEEVIYLLADTEYLPLSISHELGHYLDAKFGWVTDADFISVYNAEAYNSGLDDYFVVSPREYFAESYQMLILDPTYRNRCPLTCAYIENLISSL